MCKLSSAHTNRLVVSFVLLVGFNSNLSAAIINTLVSADGYSVAYPEPQNISSNSDSGETDADVSVQSGIYDTGLHADGYFTAYQEGFAFFAMQKFQATEVSGNVSVRYNLMNESSAAQQFSLRFSPFYGFLTAYCADPGGLFYGDTGAILPCGPDDFSEASYDAKIWLNDRVIWSSMASLRSDINGVTLDTSGTQLGSFYPDEYNYRWDSQWFDIDLDVFGPSEEFSLLYTIDGSVHGQTSLQGADSCVAFDCPYPDNVAYSEYGNFQFAEDDVPAFQFSSRAAVVNEPAVVGMFLFGLLLICLRSNNRTR